MSVTCTEPTLSTSSEPSAGATAAPTGGARPRTSRRRTKAGGEPAGHVVSPAPAAGGGAPAPVNQVRLVGHISGIDAPTQLPSGASVLAVRVVVRRPKSDQAGSKVLVDTLDVACWTPETQRQALAAGVGTHVEVLGSIRRRFFRSAAGPASRYEIEASSIITCQAAQPVADSD